MRRCVNAMMRKSVRIVWNVKIVWVIELMSDWVIEFVGFVCHISFLWFLWFL